MIFARIMALVGWATMPYLSTMSRQRQCMSTPLSPFWSTMVGVTMYPDSLQVPPWVPDLPPAPLWSQHEFPPCWPRCSCAKVVTRTVWLWFDSAKLLWQKAAQSLQKAVGQNRSLYLTEPTANSRQSDNYDLTALHCDHCDNFNGHF